MNDPCGLMLFNKPKSWTSFDAIRTIKKQLNIKKVGHSGTLDPFATGLLLIAIGKATKALEYLIKMDKKYIATMEFGKSSATWDTESEIIIDRNLKTIDQQTFSDQLHTFVGEISQIPPKYSAVKIAGKRACDRMRAGENINLTAKKVQVYDLEIITFQWPIVTIAIHCGSGFYVRGLVRDLGIKLGIKAICTELQRTAIGNFNLQDAIDANSISKPAILPLVPKYFNLPIINLNEQDLIDIQHGRKIGVDLPENNQTTIAQYQDQIVAFGDVKQDYYYPRKIII